MHRFLSVIFLALLTTHPCFPEALTLPEAIGLADRDHPLLTAGRAQIDAASAGIRTALAYPNPETNAITGRQTYRVPGNVSGWTTFFSFSQPLELGGLRNSRRELAERGRENSEIVLEGTRLAVLASVRRAFFHVLRKRGEIAILGKTCAWWKTFASASRFGLTWARSADWN